MGDFLDKAKDMAGDIKDKIGDVAENKGDRFHDVIPDIVPASFEETLQVGNESEAGPSGSDAPEASADSPNDDS